MTQRPTADKTRAILALDRNILFHGRGRNGCRQGGVFLTAALLASGLLAGTSQKACSAERIRILLDAPPQTLNPRLTQDAAGQRLAALLFPALTQKDSRLRVAGQLSASHSSDPSGTVWTFVIRPNLRDHGGANITPTILKECFENYRSGKPMALAARALEEWKTLEVRGQTMTFRLKRADPYFSRNVSLLRYFRQEGRRPCEDPLAGRPLIGAGELRAEVFSSPPEHQLDIDRKTKQGGFAPHARLLFVRDENTRVIRMLRGEADVAQNAFSPVRFRWLARKHPDRFALIEAPGVNVSYLSFNIRHPILAKKEVRQALALAVPVDELVSTKFSGMAEPASSLLSPLLEGAFNPTLERDHPARSEQLLDKAGFPRQKNGIRFSLQFKTTPLREGHELARILQERFSRLGIQVSLEVVEPAVFLAAVRRGAYELALGRWVGVADPSILERTLRSGSPTNRAGYSDPAMDALLDRADWKGVQQKMVEDLPYFPLWFWKNAVLLRKELTGIESADLSLSGALEPLLNVRWKE